MGCLLQEAPAERQPALCARMHVICNQQQCFPKTPTVKIGMRRQVGR